MSLLSDCEVAHTLSLRGAPFRAMRHPHPNQGGAGNPFSCRNAGLNSFD
jgi:hypothetical protein